MEAVRQWQGARWAGISASRHLPALVTLIGITVSLLLWQALLQEEDVAIEREATSRVRIVRGEITGHLEARVLALARMARRWEMRSGTPREEWERDASAYGQDLPGLQALAWVDDMFHVRWVAPRAGNEAVQDLDLAFDEQQRAMLEAARDQREVSLGPAGPLAQGGEGFQVYVPMYEQGAFRGFMLGVFHVPQLLDAILSEDGLAGHGIAVFDGGTLIYHRGNGSEQHVAARGREATISQPGLQWRLVVWPTPEFLSQHHSLIPAATLLIGLLFTGLLTLTLRSGSSRNVGRGCSTQPIKTWSERLTSVNRPRQRWKPSGERPLSWLR